VQSLPRTHAVIGTVFKQDRMWGREPGCRAREEPDPPGARQALCLISVHAPVLPPWPPAFLHTKLQTGATDALCRAVINNCTAPNCFGTVQVCSSSPRHMLTPTSHVKSGQPPGHPRRWGKLQGGVLALSTTRENLQNSVLGSQNPMLKLRCSPWARRNGCRMGQAH